MKVHFWSKGAKQMVTATILDGPRRKPLGKRVGSWCSREKYYAERVLVSFTVHGHNHTAWIQSSRLKEYHEDTNRG